MADADDGIWAEHLPALEAWLAVSSQMRWVAIGLGGVRAAGLDYQGARAGFELAGIEMTAERWAEVRTIEAGAVAELNGRAI